MSEELEEPFEKAFGKAPKEGYEFTGIDVTMYDNDDCKGIDIAWSASGVGFGHVMISWGVSEMIKNKWPKQYGFHADTECMGREFIEALLHAAAPALADLIVEYDMDRKDKP